MRGLVIPHAQETYSGHIAEAGLKNTLNYSFDRVVLLGANHSRPESGFYRGYSEFRRPIEPPGGIPKLEDHSIEWITRLVNKYISVPVAPLIIGNETSESIDLVRRFVTPKTLVIASSDLSHHLSAQKARERDGRTIRAILERSDDDIEACGRAAIQVLIQTVDAEPFLVAYGNSGEKTNDWSSVVGYAAIQFGGMSKSLKTANSALENLLKGEAIRAESDHVAVFVTVTQAGELQGCTGQTRPEFPLEEAVVRAFQTTLRDERYKRSSLRDSEIKISLLSKLTPTALDDVRIGRDGLVVEAAGDRSAIFLPEVPVEQEWDEETYLKELLSKGGISAQERFELFSFTTESITVLTELVG